MAITRNRSARTSSPTLSEDSDLYYDDHDLNYFSPSPAPSQADNPLGWDSDSTLVPLESTNATPTPQTMRPSTPASVVEISRDEFPPLEAHAPATATKPCAKTAKDKGKKKAKA
ncbi:hypothetical protein C8R44DRAFT_848049, partial [Mycena epipterygia]